MKYTTKYNYITKESQGVVMSSELTKARSQINSIKTLLKQEKVQAALMALSEALKIYLRTKLLKHEKKDFQRKVESAVFQLSSDQTLIQSIAMQIDYTPGEEKKLLDNLNIILGELQENTMEEAQQHLQMLEQKRQIGLKQGKEELDKENYKGAQKQFQNLVRDFPDDSELKVQISEYYLEKEMYNESLDYLKSAHKDDPDSVQIFNKLGISLRKSGNYEKAEKAFFEAIKRAQEDEYLYFNLGRVYIDWQKWDKASKVSQKALEYNPNFAEAEKMMKFSRKKAQNNN